MLFCFHGYGQKITDNLKKLEGIWIAEDYYNSFEKTNSAVKSKNAFYSGYPVGLRINTKEINNGIMNIGYSLLHDHLFHPEISDYIVKDNDTIYEQGSFKINLNVKDSTGYYKTISKKRNLNYGSANYLTWSTDNTSLVLYRKKSEYYKEEFVRYKKVTSEFTPNYFFPNPLYYYTRQKNLVGSYTLKDSLGNILSKSFRINEKGIAQGFNKFENFTFYFSTDIYCGLPLENDLIVICDNILNNSRKTFSFMIERGKDENIYLHKIQRSNIRESYVLGEKVYELIKN